MSDICKPEIPRKKNNQSFTGIVEKNIYRQCNQPMAACNECWLVGIKENGYTFMGLLSKIIPRRKRGPPGGTLKESCSPYFPFRPLFRRGLMCRKANRICRLLKPETDNAGTVTFPFEHLVNYTVM